ncbi:MAG: DUF4760 domain-containing protein [Cycloclasticus sp.]
MEVICSWLAAQSLGAYVLLASVGVAYQAIKTNRSIAKKQATINFIQHELNSDDILKAKAIVKKLKKTDTLLDFARKDRVDTEEFDAIVRLLSQYEFMAVGIHSGAFDFNILLQMKHGSTIDTHKTLHPFILKLRQDYNRESIFKDFERLAKSFKDADF